MDTYDVNELFCNYYEKWITIYKEGAIRNSTMQKYKLTSRWLKKIAPNLKIREINRITVNVNIKMYKKGKISMYKKGNIKCTTKPPIDISKLSFFVLVTTQSSPS